MTAPPAAPQPSARAAHAWQRNARLWDFHFGVVLVVAELFVAFSQGSGLWVWLTNGWLLLSVPLYLVIGRPALHGDPENSRRAIAFCASMALFYIPAATLAQEASVAMVALAPLSYMLLDRIRAMTFLLIYSIAPLVGWMFMMWGDPGRLLRTVLIAVVVAGSSMSIGGWVERIVVQSTERAELIRRLEESRDELTRLSVAHGALLERERLAREIHDTLAQGFTSLVMLCQALEGELEHNPEQARRYVDLMQRTARENLAESRSLVASLTPAQLDDSSLDDAVRRLGDRLAEELGIEVDCRVSGPPCELPPAVEVVALRAAQEALSNIRKHAHASRVELLLTHTGQGLELTVRDNGHGFVTTAGPGRGYGLPGMRARVSEVGGTTELASAPGEGTRLTVRLTVAACPSGAHAPITPLQEAHR